MDSKKKMKRTILCIILAGLCVHTQLLFGQTQKGSSEGDYGLPAFSAHIGTDFFLWDDPFLVTGGDIRFPIQQALYGSIGVDFGIHTNNDDSKTTPAFLLPIRVALVFPFPDKKKISFSLVTGLMPVFHFYDGDSSFYLGPYTGARAQIAVHPVLSLFAEVQQVLLFGGDDWINTGTRIVGGISF
ncbi:hypothetical protein Spirs_3806 [Sediminispirochaeta smaragdinae DSM 11293]|uniref:Outer membrane protein beta-barrel domain-containing protein n=2 Tax=Sediminispirochaeta TaxID=1911556 RepID=E1R837_SEDSS|nr:hypothetical protein Spirs_3806 [Sediminispirochaeta smaragdinae DSM 11293]